MYAALPNQLYHIFHYILSVAVIYIVFPRFLFVEADGDWSDRAVANMIRMVSFEIIATYALIITRLYEVIGFLGVIVVLTILLIRYLLRSAKQTQGVLAVVFYDTIEAPYVIRDWIVKFIRKVQSRPRIRIQISAKLLQSSIIVLFFIIAIIIHSDQAVMTAAPPMSDSYVDLAWVQYVNQRYFFHDGIYPQGFYIYMDLLMKFSFINTLYIIKYTGAFDVILLLLALYWILVRWTKQYFGAALAVVLYGILGKYLLFDDWTRLAATESQEFGSLFVWPTVYFLQRYLEKQSKGDFFIAFAGMCATGLIHPVSYLQEGLDCAAVLLAYVIFHFQVKKRVILLSGVAGGVSLLVILAPLLVGVLFAHATVNQGANTFIVAQAINMPPPAIGLIDYFALACIFAMYSFVFAKRQPLESRVRALSVAFIGTLAFLLYDQGGTLSHSYVIYTRSIDIWAYTECFVIGYAVQVLWTNVLARRSVSFARISRHMETSILALCLGAILVFKQISPVIPYTMQWNNDVEEYLRINSSFHYAGYLIVSPDAQGYDLVVGNGFFLDANQFVTFYDPTKYPLTRYGKSSIDLNIPSNVFLFVPTQIFKVSKSEGIYPIEVPIYAQEQNDVNKIQKWLAIYRAHHYHITLYAKTNHLLVYYIQVEKPKKKTIG